MKFLDRLHPLALLALRLALGAIMIAHGAQKAFGGMPRFMGMLQNLGIPPVLGYLTLAAEFGGGILLVLGLLTRVAALSIRYRYVSGHRESPLQEWTEGTRGI